MNMKLFVTLLGSLVLLQSPITSKSASNPEQSNLPKKHGSSEDGGEPSFGALPDHYQPKEEYEYVYEDQAAAAQSYRAGPQGFHLPYPYTGPGAAPKMSSYERSKIKYGQGMRSKYGMKSMGTGWGGVSTFAAKY